MMSSWVQELGRHTLPANLFEMIPLLATRASAKVVLPKLGKIVRWINKQTELKLGHDWECCSLAQSYFSPSSYVVVHVQ